MHSYPAWKIWLVVIVLLVGTLLALPNVFGEAPALQLSRNDRTAVTDAQRQQVVSSLQSKGVTVENSYLEGDRLVLRFDDATARLKARDVVQESAGREFLVALSEVPRALTADGLEQTIRITEAALRRDFGLARPRIAVAGLNPHAGEGGAMGTEELRFIAPLVARLAAEGLAIRGPLPADTMFHPRARAQYDVAICMYHDQALIPIKTIDFDGGVNVTLGLPFVRTSPDHGTAFDIAGRGVAEPSSLVAALRMAHQMAQARGM